jgi:hypothetical protein
MNKVAPALLAAWLLTGGLSAQEENQTVVDSFRPGLGKIVEMNRVLAKVHPFFETLYPVAVAEEGRFYLFDVEEGGKNYIFVKDVPADMAVPQGVRAAFPLDFYEQRAACVVTADAFESLEGRVLIFHEFVHCRQWETCEPRLKQRLGVARKAASREDNMWEINFPFPYDDDLFVQVYTLFLDAVAREDEATARRCRMNLREILNDDDYEYMLWQEWKEGFARWLENQARARFDLTENRGGWAPPYDRVTFYAGGSGLIALLVKQDKDLSEDMEALFERMKALSF